MADFSLRITLTAADGAQGWQFYTGPASAPMAWDRETSTETTGAVIELIDAHGEVTDDGDLDGDEWRAFEQGDGLATVHRWMNCSKFYGSLHNCLLAAQMGTDPDGWTDAHDELLRRHGERAAAVDDGGPAFPSDRGNVPMGPERGHHHGMSLRDRMGIAAMKGLLANPGCDYSPMTSSAVEQVAADAWALADAMLRARKGGTHA